MIIYNFEQYSDEWWDKRNAKPSASNGKRVITSQGKPSKSLGDYALDLAGEMYAGKSLDSFEGNAHTDRGHELEDSARSLFEMINDCEALEVGMILDDEELYIASPDGVINGDGILEIKCLKASNHIKAHVYYKKHGKMPTDYVSQVQMQLFVSGFKYAKIMFYHPDLPELIIDVKPDLEFHKVLEQQLNEVISERDNIINLLKEA